MQTQPKSNKKNTKLRKIIKVDGLPEFTIRFKAVCLMEPHESKILKKFSEVLFNGWGLPGALHFLQSTQKWEFSISLLQLTKQNNIQFNTVFEAREHLLKLFKNPELIKQAFKEKESYIEDITQKHPDIDWNEFFDSQI